MRRAKTMTMQVTANKNQQTIIDPELLFQRLLIIAESSLIDLNDMMSCELCAYPTSLFESPGLLHRADKSKLVDAIVDYVKNNADLENYRDEETDVFAVLLSLSFLKDFGLFKRLFEKFVCFFVLFLHQRSYFSKY